MLAGSRFTGGVLLGLGYHVRYHGLDNIRRGAELRCIVLFNHIAFVNPLHPIPFHHYISPLCLCRYVFLHLTCSMGLCLWVPACLIGSARPDFLFRNRARIVFVERKNRPMLDV